MDAKRLDLEAIKQDWQESRWSFASRGGWAENNAHALFEALEGAWRENERLLPYKEAAEAYIDTGSLDAFRHLQMVVHKNRQGHTK